MAVPRPYRTKYVAKLRAPPDQWSPDWLQRMDARFKAMALVRAHLAELESDLSAGDPTRLSWTQRRLANHLVWADTFLEDLERKFARGEDVDIGNWASLLGALNRTARLLGITRRQREIRGIRDVLAEHERGAA
jgi:hypothetical protein